MLYLDIYVYISIYKNFCFTLYLINVTSSALVTSCSLLPISGFRCANSR